MTDFIKQQQELARKELGEPAEGYSHYNVDGCTVERLIEQAITNTGEDLMRLAEGERKAPYDDDEGDWEIHHRGYDEAIDTLKKHITNLTDAK